jgi:ribosomal protein S18 acetylase RimI-like enzyme
MNSCDCLIVFSKIKSGDPLLVRIKNTYESSFPEEERRAFSLVHKLIIDKPAFAAYALFQNDKYIGFITAWAFENFVYIEHFAIELIYRNSGIGAKVMRQFLLNKRSIVLEVEEPKDDLSRRRVNFYVRLGFVLDSHFYFQPSYHKDGDRVKMRLMSYGDINMEDSFDKVCNILYENVYGRKKRPSQN